MTKTLLIESQYLPPIEYFYHVVWSDELLIEGCETFQKQTYRNRCRILTANKVDILTVPVINKGRGVLIKEVRIDYSQKWLNIHWRSIQSAYGKAPFFEHYAEYFHNILFKKYANLFDLNMELMTLCLKLLRVDKSIRITEDYTRKGEVKEAFIQDYRSEIDTKSDNKPDIITRTPYMQVFGSNFVPNLSIIDLLFCKGPESLGLIKANKKVPTNKNF